MNQSTESATFAYDYVGYWPLSAKSFTDNDEKTVLETFVAGFGGGGNG